MTVLRLKFALINTVKTISINYSNFKIFWLIYIYRLAVTAFVLLFIIPLSPFTSSDSPKEALLRLFRLE